MTQDKEPVVEGGLLSGRGLHYVMHFFRKEAPPLGGILPGRMGCT